jgi:hypothetical protein
MLESFLAEISNDRRRETDTVRRHLEVSLHELIDRQNKRYAALHLELEAGGENINLVHANIKQTADRIDELNHRLETRLAELDRECQVSIADTVHVGSAWVLPHPERSAPAIAPMVSDPDIERIAVEAVIAFEEKRGWRVTSVERDNKGFDLISRRYLQDDPETYAESRFIEVKGRAGVGEVALSENEYKTAERLRAEYWLYVVYNCASTPEVHVINDPFSKLGWKPVVQVAHYHVGASDVLNVTNQSN